MWFRRKCKVCASGINVVNNALCGHPGCSTLAVMAFLFETGVIYACINHYPQIIEMAEKLKN